MIKIKIKSILMSLFGILPSRIKKSKCSTFFDKITPLSTNHKLIRLGNISADGGYLIPDDLEGITTCFSPGVANTCGFELDLVKRNIQCFLADYSVEDTPIQHELIQFEKKFLSNVNDDIHMTLSSWVESHAKQQDNDMILQMDIERSEYEVLIETPSAILERFRIIIIEFHSIERFILNGFFNFMIDGIFTKLLKSFEIVHIHPNNVFPPLQYKEFYFPRAIELTFLRKDRIAHSTKTETFPHPLDRPNVLKNDDYPLPACWYKNRS